MREQTGLYLRGATWWIRYRDPAGKEIRESSGSGDAKVARKLRETRVRAVANERSGIRRFQGPASERLTVWALLDNLQRHYETRRIKGLREVGTHMRPLRVAFGSLKAVRVTTTAIDAYVAARREDGMADATIDRELEILHRAFTLATESSPPLVAWVPRMPRLVAKGANARQGFVERADFERLVAELPSDVLKDVARWGYFTGMRLGEIKALTWKGYDREARMMQLPAKNAKTGKARKIALTGWPALGDLIERRLAVRRLDSLLVFHNGQGGHVGEFYTTWARAIARANVPAFTFHDLRRTAVRNMIRAGIDRTVAKAISGHTTDSMFERYNITDERDLVEANEKRSAYEDRLSRASGGSGGVVDFAAHNPRTID